MIRFNFYRIFIKNICFGEPINVSAGSEIFVTTVSPKSKTFKDLNVLNNAEKCSKNDF